MRSVVQDTPVMKEPPPIGDLVRCVVFYLFMLSYPDSPSMNSDERGVWSGLQAWMGVIEAVDVVRFRCYGR